MKYLFLYVIIFYGKKLINSIPTDKNNLNLTEIKICTLGNDGKTEEKDITKLRVSRYGRKNNIYGHKFEDSVKCVEVKYKDESIWKHDPIKNGNNFPEKLILNVARKVVWVIMESVCYGFMCVDNKWVIRISKERTLTKKRKLHQFDLNNSDINNHTVEDDSDKENQFGKRCKTIEQKLIRDKNQTETIMRIKNSNTSY